MPVAVAYRAASRSSQPTNVSYSIGRRFNAPPASAASQRPGFFCAASPSDGLLRNLTEPQAAHDTTDFLPTPRRVIVRIHDHPLEGAVRFLPQDFQIREQPLKSALLPLVGMPNLELVVVQWPATANPLDERLVRTAFDEQLASSRGQLARRSLPPH